VSDGIPTPRAGPKKRTESVPPPSSFPDRPPPKRLPAGRAFNLRRSVLGAIAKLSAISQFVNPFRECFVRKLRHSSFGRRSGDTEPGASRRFGSELPVHAKMHRARLASVRSPDRPPPKRLPLGGPSTSGAPSSVQLGDYGSRDAASRSSRTENSALCDLFFTNRTYLRQVVHALPKQDHGFAEPGALSSTSPTDLPLPRTALRGSFVLVASRARRSAQSTLSRPSGARGSDDGNAANCERVEGR
jgi:hypothetical protein